MHLEDPQWVAGRRYHLGPNKGVFDAEVYSAVPDGYRWKTSLSRMIRVVTVTCSRLTAPWISDRVGLQRKYGPPRGKGVRRRPSAGRVS